VGFSGRVDIFSVSGWFWRAWRARSITFAALFALSLLGVSVLSGFRHVLKALGAPWLIWLVVPFAVVALVSRKEAEWVPEAADRRKWAIRLIVGSIVVALVVAKFRPDPVPDSAAPVRIQGGGGGRANPHGR
jgi:hypothetical protein